MLTKRNDFNLYTKETDSRLLFGFLVPNNSGVLCCGDDWDSLNIAPASPTNKEKNFEFRPDLEWVFGKDQLALRDSSTLSLHAANWRVYDCNTTHKVFHISHTHTTHIYWIGDVI